MKITLMVLTAIVGSCLLAGELHAGWADKFKELLKPATQTSLGATKIGQGLKEALSIGIDRAVAEAGKKDGYAANPAIRIKLPDSLASVSGMMRKVGMGPSLDAFEANVNRAAEQAAPASKKILLDALFAMNIEDAQKLLKGGETAATDYFKAKTREPLYQAFLPKMQEAMSSYSVAQKYNQLATAYAGLPVPSKPKLESADTYATNKALDGLFYLVAQQEKKIRTDPAARVTELLKTVFAS
ncbi:MAG: DUF4197 domain-containing protein [Candidatus Omnitrophota bacterium]|jgi:hypothetical protein